VATDMGGSIRVESEVGAGSTFRVRLPAWRGEAPGDA
jgi:signal transduction histidine kinase